MNTPLNGDDAQLLRKQARFFRNIADRDYIAARSCFRSDLLLQSLWMGLQAVEKYLKAILLFNYTPAKFSHDLPTGVKKIRDKTDLGQNFKLSPEVEGFLEYLFEQGENRYADYEIFVDGDALDNIDRAVFEVRLYCERIDWSDHPSSAPINFGGKTVEPRGIGSNSVEVNLQTIHRHLSEGSRRTLTDGYLEKVIAKAGHLHKDTLSWRNRYYPAGGTVEPNQADEPSLLFHHEKPPHQNDPSKFTFLKDFVRFSKKTHNRILGTNSANSPTGN